jgi:hypothetical protein
MNYLTRKYHKYAANVKKRKHKQYEGEGTKQENRKDKEMKEKERKEK